MGRKSSFLFIAGVAILMVVSGMCMGQQDTTGKRDDSLNAAIIANYNGRLIEIEKQRVQDSVRKTELEAKLNALSTTDNLKKEELQRQLQELREADGNRLLNKKRQIDSLRLTAVGYPVTGFFNDTLFTIFSGLGSFSARERADVISARVKRIAGGYRYKKDTLSLTETESTVDISYGETIIMSVSESDALWGNGTKTEVAQRFLESINSAEKNYISETGLVMLIKEVGLALLVIALVGVLMFYLRKLFRWTAQKIRDQENKRINGIKIRSYVLFDARRQINALLNLNTVVFWAVIIIVVYVSLPILFGIFPWTKHFADTLFGYILTPFRKIILSIWNFIPNIITIAVIVFVFRYVLKLIRFLKTEIENGKLHLPGFYPDWANPTYQIVRVIVFSFMVIVIFPYLPGSNSPVFQGVSVFLGFLFTFGSAGSLSNVVAGLVLTYMRLFKLGDRVKIGEVVGDVIEKSLLVTRIRTIKNEIISIPNTTVMNSHAINYSSDAPDRGLIIHTTVTIGYDVPWKQIHQALIDAALRTKLVLTDPAPFVLQTSLDDFYVSYQINAYTREPNKQATIYSDLHQHIQDVCNEVGIEILSPHYKAARDGNATTIPHDYLPEDYKAPGFNVHVKNDKE
jgi:small-conductance mechanosensitive channel